MAEPLLTLDRVSAGYGSSVVLEEISLTLGEGGSLAILGRNGVGKTSLLLTIMGLTRQHQGAIAWRGRDVAALPAHRRALLGIGWVAQEREIFASLSVEENLSVSARRGRWILPRVYELFPRLAERRQQRGNRLSGGEQQMLAIARALMTNPALLLLDEPLEGLAPVIVEELARAISRMRAEEGMALMLVEQHARFALELSERALVLERGRVAHAAASADLMRDAAILERLLGLAIDARP
jgi:branched-chain amino acid transport system ATP-binding protein